MCDKIHQYFQMFAHVRVNSTRQGRDMAENKMASIHAGTGLRIYGIEVLIPGPAGSLSGIHFDPARKWVKLAKYEKQKIEEVGHADSARQLITRELHSGQLPFRFKDAADTQASWHSKLPFGCFWPDAQIDWTTSSAVWRPFVLTMTDAVSAPGEPVPAGAAQIGPQAPEPEPSPSEPETVEPPTKPKPATPADKEPTRWVEAMVKQLRKPGESAKAFAARMRNPMNDVMLAALTRGEVTRVVSPKRIENIISKNGLWPKEPKE